MKKSPNNKLIRVVGTLSAQATGPRSRSQVQFQSAAREFRISLGMLRLEKYMCLDVFW